MNWNGRPGKSCFSLKTLLNKSLKISENPPAPPVQLFSPFSLFTIFSHHISSYFLQFSQVTFYQKNGNLVQKSQAQPPQTPVQHLDGAFVQHLPQLLRRLRALQEAAEAGLVQRDAFLVVGLL